MSERVSSGLDELKGRSLIPNPWVGSRYEWFKAVSGAEAGKIGELLAQLVLGGRLTGRDSGYDLRLANGRRVEVKLCRKSYSENNMWSWKQIRRADDYDDLCLIAVDPKNCRLFLIPREKVPATALSNNHGRLGDRSICQIAHYSDLLPKWMTDHEVL